MTATVLTNRYYTTIVFVFLSICYSCFATCNTHTSFLAISRSLFPVLAEYLFCSVFCFILLVFCCCKSLVSSGQSWMFHFSSSHPPSSFSHQICSTFFDFPKKIELAPTVLLDGFLPGKTRLWAARLNDSFGTKSLWCDRVEMLH